MTSPLDPFNRPVGRRSLIMAAAGLAALGPVLSACGGSSSSASPATPTGKPVDGGALIWAIETQLSSANPHTNGQDKARPILRNAFDSLIFLDGDGKYQPWLARTITPSADGTVLTLELRTDVTFSDGEKFNAAAVVKNFDKLSDAKYATSAAGALSSLKKYEATGPYTVKFTLSKPDNYFLTWLAGVTAAPISPKSLALSMDELQAGGPKIAGTGPFTISTYSLNTEIVFTRRKDYAWAPAAIAKGQKAAHLEKVTYRTLKEGSARTGALSRSQVDVASDIQPLDVETFTSNPRFAYVRATAAGSPYSLYFNVSKTPFEDIRVRQAFAQGADITAIVNSIYRGTYQRAWAPYNLLGPYQDPSLKNWLKFDKAAANKLLDKAGWATKNASGIRTKRGKTLTVRTVSASDYVRESRDQLNVALAAALKQNIGIDYKFQAVDLGTEANRAKANDYEIFDNSYGGADPVVPFDLLYYSSDPSRGYIARGRYNDKQLEKLIDDARFSNDTAARKKTYKTIQEYVTKEKYYALPLAVTQDTYAYNAEKVAGIVADPATGGPFSAYTAWVASK
ncbi:ABC transporter substrate-binding protein [Acidipropionibacterium virtanenii]|uniref:Nickel-binding periplasmic protein n=1 Tax=Acidipropionibacterium virtanenii TaxID=2057246 RepID=A0A344UY40_9ACTN|nr:ABC transporter substrate-binding protein [Acidipropionibacterium virtanenii]AXE40188.1 Nickel-binding periplasmic protein [Acidipropionibacterium virtanenii]